MGFVWARGWGLLGLFGGSWGSRGVMAVKVIMSILEVIWGVKAKVIYSMGRPLSVPSIQVPGFIVGKSFKLHSKTSAA